MLVIRVGARSVSLECQPFCVASHFHVCARHYNAATAAGSPLRLAAPPDSGGGGAVTPSQPEAVPPPRAQLGLAAPLTGRAPQKYLIQNQSGLKVFYWADKVREYCGEMQEIRSELPRLSFVPPSVTVWLCHTLLELGVKRLKQVVYGALCVCRVH